MSEDVAHPGSAGVHHRKRDFYSESRPVPSIQRFFRRGLRDALLQGEDSEEEAEAEGEANGSRLGRRIAQHEQKKTNDVSEEPSEEQSRRDDDDDDDDAKQAIKDAQQGPSTERRTHKPRRVYDPITHRDIYIHDVGKREYEHAMRQADLLSEASRKGQSSGPAAGMANSMPSASPVPQSKPTLTPLKTSSPMNATFDRSAVDEPGRAEEHTVVSPTRFARLASMRRKASHQRNPSKSGSLFSGRKSGTFERPDDENQGDEGVNEDESLRRDAGPRSPSQPQRARDKAYGDVQNVLSLPFPPSENFPEHILRIHPMILPSFLVWALLLYFDVVPRLLSIAFIPWLSWFSFRHLQAEREDQHWQRERKRGQTATSRQSGAGHDHDKADFETWQSGEGIKEGAEWLNSIIQGVWSVMNPDLFSSLGATLEDVMQASIPGFIHAVKVEDLAQGSTPLRLSGFRVLPDREADELRTASQKHMKDKRMQESRKLVDAKGERQSEGTADDGDRHEEDAGASFINLELSFIYRARPTTDNVASKSRNAHLLIKFWIGAKKLITVPLPIWVEIKGIVGSVRARIQLTPDPPFVKNVTFCFMGLPRVGVEVIPLRINTSNIPLLSGFIQGSIDAAMAEYCAPSSLTMDVGEMLMGDNIKREVDALGVVVVHLHSATDLEKQDVRGSSDPYCTVQLAKHGKVQYATRVALNDLSPRWEERFVLLVRPEAVQAREKISVALWDSDRFSADDMLGRVAGVELYDLVKRPGKLFTRTDTLVGLTNEMKKQGTVRWSVGFFRKTSNRRHVSTEAHKATNEPQAHGDDDKEDTVEEIDVGRDHHESKADGHDNDLAQLHVEDYDNRVTTQQTRNVAHAVAYEPPNPSLPSGILSMQIHQVSQLEVIDTRTNRSSQRHASQPGQDVEQVESQEDRSNAPSAYVNIILNDETIFRSRTKALSTNPFYNAGTERFVRDWRRCMVMFVVYDHRLRESDAILGVVPIKLTDVFSSTSQVTTVFPLAGGVGRGHLRISLLFRPVQGISHHKSLLGWDIGTMRILSSLTASNFANGDAVGMLNSASVRAYSLAGHCVISSRRCRLVDDGHVEWQLNDDDFPMKVPVRRRYATPYVIEFRSPRAFGIHRKVACCILWMQDVSDDDIVEYRLPIWKARDGHDLHRLLQNYHDYRNEREAQQMGVEKIAELQVKLQFKSGVGKIHTKFDSNPDAKVVMDAWRASTSAGLRDVMGDFTQLKIDEQGMPIDRRGTLGKANASSESIGTLQSSVANDGDQSPDDDSPADDDTDDEDDDEEATTKQPRGQSTEQMGIKRKLDRWTEERKELHRQHRGLKQYKSVRTASWIGRGIRDRGSRAMNNLKMQDKRSAQVESEL